MPAPADRPPDELRSCKRCGTETEHRFRWHTHGKGKPGKWRPVCLACRANADKRYNGSRKGKRRTKRHRRAKRKARSSPPTVAKAAAAELAAELDATPTCPELAALEGFD